MVTLPENECPQFFVPYLQIVESDILKELEDQLSNYAEFVRNIPKDKELFRYAPGKWTVKEVIGHNTDTERIKLFTALRIARNDQTPIPGFDEDAYVAATDFNSKSMAALIEDFEIMRKGSISLFKSFSEDEIKRIGIASNKQVSVRVLFYFMIGHIRHHEHILKDRYFI
ncbi:MAG TPA: DinB family protein [Edaphocola sp.]|nr:DinB family protein [Edaphocola sp.]